MSNIRAPNKSRRQAPFEPSARFWQWGIPILLVGLTVIAFYPALQNGFVNWDDDRNIVENPFYRGLHWTNIQWMFTTFHMGHYQPLTWLTLSIDYLFWGLNPVGYHLTNLLLHCLNAVVLYFLAFRLFVLADPALAGHQHSLLPLAAGFSALLFSVHPLRVESVTWATERRDVLSGLFFLLSILCYLKAVTNGESGSRHRRWIFISLGAYVLSLLSKASAMTLPVVLLVLDVYPLRRLGPASKGWFSPETRKVWREKLLFVAFAVCTGVTALFAQYTAGAYRSLEQHGIASRFSQALYALMFYLWKTVLPFNLSPLYEIPLNPQFWRWSFFLSGFVAIGITVVLFSKRRRWPAVLASWIVYGALLAPISGIAQSGPQLVGDRYSYLSCMSWALLAGGGLVHLWQLSLSGSFASRLAIPVTGFAAVALVGLGALTWRQTQIWKDSERLWRHALLIQKESGYAHNNLGMALAEQNRLDEAIVEFREVLQINPTDADGHHNLGNALARKGRLGEAVEQFHEALRIHPGHAKAHYDLGNALARQGELDTAVVHFRQALFFAPQDARAHYNLGQILVRQGKLEEAIQHYRLALRIDPAHVKARYHLAVTLAEQGDFNGAGKEFREVLRIEPNLAEAHAGLARALSAQGKKDQAVQHYQEAVRLLKSPSENMNEGSNK
jgi:Flp pilus assembly protein TadD